ncbi:uncharacterized protein [Hoplias malabaricus]|uniref:uncharacterized protein n=1 Tax=Hoplias malabaricus TaxID=27720 RepID=UPI00346363D2
MDSWKPKPRKLAKHCLDNVTMDETPFNSSLKESMERSQNHRYSLRKIAEVPKRFDDYLVDLGKPKPRKLAQRYVDNMAVVDDMIYPFSYAEIMYKGMTMESVTPRSMEGLYGQSSMDNVPGADQPLLIHGHSVSDYQSIYCSVVEPQLKSETGEQQRYSLHMGRKIKQQLWDRLFCTTSSEVLQSEDSCSPAVNCRPPDIDVDISEEPMPPQPKRNMAQKTKKRKRNRRHR